MFVRSNGLQGLRNAGCQVSKVSPGTSPHTSGTGVCGTEEVKVQLEHSLNKRLLSFVWDSLWERGGAVGSVGSRGWGCRVITGSSDVE